MVDKNIIMIMAMMMQVVKNEYIYIYIYASFALSFAMDCCDYGVYRCLWSVLGENEYLKEFQKDPR